VGAVAERLVLRLPATAERHGGLVRREGELVAQVIDEAEWPFDHKRAIRTAANAEIGHAGECADRNSEYGVLARNADSRLGRSANWRRVEAELVENQPVGCAEAIGQRVFHRKRNRRTLPSFVDQ
jgi:hypothetical protein